MTKIAILADVHGNVTAFEAVLADIKRHAVDTIWFLGDLLMPGPGGEDLLEMLAKENITAYIRGNWEDCFLDVIAGRVDITDASDVYVATLALDLLPDLSAASLQKLTALPMTATKKVNGLTFGLSHALPHKNYGSELYPTQPQANFDDLFSGRPVDIAITAHTHQQFLRQSSAGQLVINPGSVGQPFQHWSSFARDLRAQYALVEVDAQGLPDIQFKKVAYNVKGELARAQKAHLPFVTFYEDYFKNGDVYTHDDKKIAAYPDYARYVEKVQAFLAKRDK